MGHPAALAPATVSEIVRMARDGAPYARIARDLGVSASSVRKYARKAGVPRRWARLAPAPGERGYSLGELRELSGMTYSTVHRRVSRGLPFAEVVDPAPRPPGRRAAGVAEHGGRWYTVRELAGMADVDEQTIRERLARGAGWTELTAPPHPGRRRSNAEGMGDE